MSTPETKERILDDIDHADDKVLEAIYTLLEANVNQYTLTDEQIYQTGLGLRIILTLPSPKERVIQTASFANPVCRQTGYPVLV